MKRPPEPPASLQWPARCTSRMPGVWAALLLTVVHGLAASSGVHAQAQPRAELTLTTPSGATGCPSELELKRSVAAELGYWPFDPPFAKHVRARIEPAGVGLAGLVEVSSAQGEPVGSRRLSSPTRDCSELAAALVLALSVAIDPTILVRPAAPPAPAPAAVPEPTPVAQPVVSQPLAPPAPAREQPPAEPAARPALHVLGAVSTLLSVGALPAPHAAFTALVELQRKALVVGLEGRVDLPAQKGTPGTGSVEASLYAGSLLACGRFSWFGVCGVASFGALLGRGVDLARTDRSTSLFAALGVRASGDIKLHDRLWLRPFVEPAAVLSRTTLRVGTHDVWTSPPAAFSLGLALVGRLR